MQAAIISEAEHIRLLEVERQHKTMCARLADCIKRHGVVQDGGLYADQVIIAALDDSAGFA